MEYNRRKQILQRGLEIEWRSEPLLGSYYDEEEIEVVVKTIRDSMDVTVGFGFICKEIEEFEAAFAAYCGTADSVSINGAGTGLDMAMMCLDLDPGDEVICPAVNFKAAPLSIIGQGGRWVPCEVDPDTFQADPADVAKRITPRTRAIYPVHMNGLSAPMETYREIGERHPHPKHGPLKVIGDAARALGGGYQGRKIGKDGWMTVFSFHTQKNMTTLGEGGAVTTDDPAVAKRLRQIRQFGGELTWGTNYKMTKVQAAVGLVQLRKLDKMIESRRRIAHARNEMLAGLPEITPPYEPPDCTHSYYMYTVMVPKEWAGSKRNQLMALLRDEYKVDTCIANAPASSVVPYLREQSGNPPLPVSEETSLRFFVVPIHPRMSDADNEYLCAALWDAVEKLR